MKFRILAKPALLFLRFPGYSSVKKIASLAKLGIGGFVRLASLLALLVALFSPAFGRIEPSFDLDHCSWNATHIALVATTPQDEMFVVIESWKGSLNPGDNVSVPDLRPASDAVPIPPYSQRETPFSPFANEPIERIPRQPVGSRMILFLRRVGEAAQVSGDVGAAQGSDWESSDVFHEMKTSALWVDRGALYAFVQLMNPGPSVLTTWDMSIDKVKSRVVELNQLQQALTAALNVRDGKERAERLKPYVLSDVFPAKRLALEELGKCGPSAMEAIKNLLDDPAFADEAADLIDAYSWAGGEAAGEELTARLQKELSFWRVAGPSLSSGWWNQDATPHAPVRARYMQTIQLIRGLERAHYAAALGSVIQLRDLWRSLPQLNDPSGLDQMVRECDHLISHLGGPSKQHEEP